MGKLAKLGFLEIVITNLIISGDCSPLILCYTVVIFITYQSLQPFALNLKYNSLCREGFNG